MTKVRVEVADDFLAKLRRSARRGVVELIDNALDADATTVTVSFSRTALGAVESVTIADDGDGMTESVARSAFGTLGNSWKVGAPHILNGTLDVGPAHGHGFQVAAHLPIPASSTKDRAGTPAC